MCVCNIMPPAFIHTGICPEGVYTRSQGGAEGGGTKKKNQKNEGKKGGLARGAAGVEEGVGGEGSGGEVEAEVGVDPSKMAGAGSNNFLCRKYLPI